MDSSWEPKPSRQIISISVFDDLNSVPAVGTSYAKILRIRTHRHQHDTTQATLVETYQPLTVYDYRSNKGCYIAFRTWITPLGCRLFGKDAPCSKKHSIELRYQLLLRMVS